LEKGVRNRFPAGGFPLEKGVRNRFPAGGFPLDTSITENGS
jgi:hypothetical protein